MSRVDGRIPEQLRSVKIERNYTKYAEGSVLIKVGDTQVLCTASIEDKVPPFLRGSGEGWITAEYSMLPRATQTRNQREASKGKLGGRTMEIQRLIGRSLRSVVNLKGLGEKTLWIDCDVLQADGGTRTAAITGSFVALVDALYTLMERGVLSKMPLTDFLAATSVGIVGGKPVVDLCYAEDSKAEVDMNLVMTGAGEFVEVQGTAEGAPFNRENLNELLELGTVGISQLILIQKQSLGSCADLVGVKA